MTMPQSTDSATSAAASAKGLDAVEAGASFAQSLFDRATIWADAASSAVGDERKSECLAEAAHGFAEADAPGAALQCLDALLAIVEPTTGAAQRGVDAANILGDLGRALRLYTWVLPAISDDEKRASVSLDLADQAEKLPDRPLERFFLREVLRVRREETLLVRFARSAIQSFRDGGGLDDDDRQHALLSLMHLARKHRNAAGFSYASSALELEPTSDEALDLFVDCAIAANMQAAARQSLANALFILGSARQSRALDRVAASLDDRPTGTLPEAPSSMPSIVDIDELAASDSHALDPRILALLAEAAAVKSFPSLHVAKLREVLAIDPLEENALAELRGILAARGDHEGLREVLSEASDAAKRNDWPVSRRLSIVRELAELCAGPLDDPFGAIAALEELVRSDPKNMEARAALRGHLERVGRWDAVVGLVEEGLASASNPAEFLAELARLHLDKRRDPASAALALLRRAQLLVGDVEAWREAIQLVRSLRDGARLEAVLLEALATIGTALTTTERAQLTEDLGRLRQSAGDVAGAERYFTEAALSTRDARLFAAAEACATELGEGERAARAALAQADLADDRQRADHLLRAAGHFADAGARKIALATLRDAVTAGALLARVRPILSACAQGDAGETFDWTAAIALRTSQDKSAWLAIAEELAPGHASSPRAISLVKELMRLGPSASRFRLLAPLPWATDDELRALVEATAARTDLPPALRVEAALLTAQALRSQGDDAGAMRVLRTLPEPLDFRVVSELLDAGAGALDAPEELALIDKALSFAEADESLRKAWLERSVGLANFRHDGPRELRYLQALLALDPEDFDRVARATTLARDLDDVETLDRCLGLSIEAEADDSTLEAFVRERATLLIGRMNRAADAEQIVAANAAKQPELRLFWVEVAAHSGLVASATRSLLTFDGLDPACAALDAWLEKLPSSDDWLALALGAFHRSLSPSRTSLALAIARGSAEHSKALFLAMGPSRNLAEARSEATALAALGLADEAFSSILPHTQGFAPPSLGAPELSPDLLDLVLALAPSADAAATALLRCRGVSGGDHQRGIDAILARVEGAPAALVPWLAQMQSILNPQLLAEYTNDRRVLVALSALSLAWEEEPLRAIFAGLERLGGDEASRAGVLARLFAVAPSAATETHFGGDLARAQILGQARGLAHGAEREAVSIHLVRALLADGDDEQAQAVAHSLLAANMAHRELFEEVLEHRGFLVELASSMEKRWSLEKDGARRLALARRIAATLEAAGADPREIADAWRRVLRLDARDAEATASLERAKARTHGSVARMAVAVPPSSPSSSARVAAASSARIAAASSARVAAAWPDELRYETPFAPLAVPIDEPMAFITQESQALSPIFGDATAELQAFNAGQAEVHFDDDAPEATDGTAAAAPSSHGLSLARSEATSHVQSEARLPSMPPPIPEALESADVLTDDLLIDDLLQSVPDQGELG